MEAFNLSREFDDCFFEGRTNRMVRGLRSHIGTGRHQMRADHKCRTRFGLILRNDARLVDLSGLPDFLEARCDQ